MACKLVVLSSYQCSLEEATELNLVCVAYYAETISVYGTEDGLIDADDTPWSKSLFGVRLRFSRLEDALFVNWFKKFKWTQSPGAFPMLMAVAESGGCSRNHKNGFVSCIGIPTHIVVFVQSLS